MHLFASDLNRHYFQTLLNKILLARSQTTLNKLKKIRFIIVVKTK